MLSRNEFYPGFPMLGPAIIFNQHTFQDRLKLSARDGTKKDKETLVSTLTSIGMKVQAYDNLTTAKILEKVARVAQEDHSNDSCIVVAILTHGGILDSQQILYSYDGTYKLRELIEACTSEKCKTLHGKPKIFFVQVREP